VPCGGGDGRPNPGPSVWHRLRTSRRRRHAQRSTLQAVAPAEAATGVTATRRNLNLKSRPHLPTYSTEGTFAQVPWPELAYVARSKYIQTAHVDLPPGRGHQTNEPSGRYSRSLSVAHHPRRPTHRAQWRGLTRHVARLAASCFQAFDCKHTPSETSETAALRVPWTLPCATPAERPVDRAPRLTTLSFQLLAL